MEENIYFEISDAGNFVRIEPVEYSWPESELDWDNNWIKCIIKIKAGRFSGEYEAEFMTVDFERFRKELSWVYDNLEGPAVFSGLEGQLEIKVKGDGLGHLEVTVTARDEASIYGSELTTTLNVDQTYIKDYQNQLDKIMQAFPKVGKLD